MSQLRLLAGLALLLGVLLPALPVEPAFACSCAMQDVAEHVERADIIAIGTVESTEYPKGEHGTDGIISSLDPIRATVGVERYLKGTGGEALTLDSPRAGPSCGFLSPEDEGRRYVLFLTLTDDGYTSSLCAGNERLDKEHGQDYLAEVLEITGEGTTPVRDGDDRSPDLSGGQTVPTPAEGASPFDRLPGPALGLGAGIALAGVSGLAIAYIRRR
ncbi:MAG: hypothetical protein WD645_07045 [Dehalococcoidia bacterium]